ncbi:NUDIX hydrolase [Haloechinothrix sp. LS1_15]|uniref:NUDIX hydrolase n=1 Tax=Haloechinothrix sp. LS1_15 TaxID=2652248 RepID=UPI0029456828|nr:NUDIX hydrolase [Haloechinothrix sp. LS1_15]MDV6011376.1 NUDIX hydrolase [Haloechinothrix sp. LS1_15]
MTRTAGLARPPIAAAVIVRDGAVLLVRRRVAEGSLVWQFPAGEVEDGESPGEAAVREAREETGLTVVGWRVLGERVHPVTGRSMVYVACGVVQGEASVVDTEELADLAWLAHDQLAEYVPHGFYEPVQQHLDALLPG